ncbi:hypothetical protein PVL29_012194 [Vitis rotundifolia]|uniref:Uncharacterized protein n=1 Tax=Vitis rotundifolia TaxID=103349 RepID=A0AA38ZQE6_VITRO|nr:hypothetical protein PVL29_012194 [Vitis rotundifolia]
MVHVPPIDAVGFGQELVMIPSIEDACPTKDGTSASTPSGNASKRNSLHFSVLIRCRRILLRRRRKCEALHAHLVWVESELTAVRKATTNVEKLLKELEKGMQVVKVEVHQMGEKKEVAKAKCKDTEQESD